MTTVIQSSFTGGELADTLDARTDLNAYDQSVAEMINFYPHIHGGASNRPGTKLVNETKSSNKKSIIVRFQFSTAQLYFLEFGDLYIRFYKDGGRIESPPGTPVEVVTPYVEADLANLKFEQSADRLYIRHPSYPRAELTRTSHTSWTYTTPATAASIASPGTITRSSGSATGRYYVVTAVSAIGEETPPSTQSAAFGWADTLTWTAVAGASYYNVYETLNQATNGSYGWIGRANTNVFTVPSNLTPDANKGVPVARTLFNAASDYPGVAVFHDQRLVEARTNNNPQSFFTSVIGVFNNFNISAPLRDDDAITRTLNSQQVNEIRWLVSLTDLVIGTAGGEWRVSPGVNSDTITPASTNIKRQSQWGVDNLSPLVIGNTILFLEASRKKVRDLTYSLDINGYDSQDVTIFAQHLLEDYGISSWGYQQGQESIVWGCRDDGVLLGMTYHKEHKINGWHRHVTDGQFESVACATNATGSGEVWFIVKRTINGTTKRFVEQMARREFNDVYSPWFVDCGLQYNTPKTITGITKANPGVVTCPAHGFSNGDIVLITDVAGMDQVNKFYYTVDAATTNTFALKNKAGTADVSTAAYGTYVSGGAARKCATTFTGLSHLEGKTVAVLADGSQVTGKVVTSGQIVLDTPAAFVTVGLPYTCDLWTLDLNYNTQAGPIQDKHRQVKTVLLKLRKSRTCWVGPNADRLSEIKFRTTEPNGVPIDLYTGTKEIEIYAGEERSSRVFVRTYEPLPLTVQAIMARIVNAEK